MTSSGKWRRFTVAAWIIASLPLAAHADGNAVPPVTLPADDLFEPLLADPKETQFYVSHRWYDTPADSVRIAAIGLGERFGFYRRYDAEAGDAMQFGIAAGVLAQFNLDAPSSDLVNADYIVGFPVTYQNGAYSARARIYHQSSHLGDEFLLGAHPERVNLSYEALELIGSYRYDSWRVYGGGEYLFHREPESLKPGVLHAGFEYNTSATLLPGSRWVAGVDLKSFEHHGWDTDVSVIAGLQYGRGDANQRRVLLLAEYFKGHSPHGQFYEEQIRYTGIRLIFGF